MKSITLRFATKKEDCFRVFSETTDLVKSRDIAMCSEALKLFPNAETGELIISSNPFKGSIRAIISGWYASHLTIRGDYFNLGASQTRIIRYFHQNGFKTVYFRLQ